MEKVFAELIQRLKAEPDKIGDVLFAAESEFERSGFREEVSIGVQNILIVRLDAIGDMVLTSGFLREVRTNFPCARITLVCSPLVRPIVELCPYVNEILTFDKDAFNRDFTVMFERIATFCRENLWQEKFELAFSPQWGSDNLPGLLMMWLSGARERIGYGVHPYANWGVEPSAEEAAFDNFLLTKNIVPPQEAFSEVEHHFFLLQAIGIEINRDDIELFYGAADVLQACAFLRDVPPNCKKVLLGIGAGFGSRQYPAEKLLIALRVLAEKDLCFVIVGGRAELDDANFIENSLPRGKVLNLAGKTTLRETEAIIALTDYYIGNDSGVMHMAAASKIPCVVLYREAQDKEDCMPGLFSEYRRFPPWQTKSVILRPDRQLEDCASRSPIYGWCHHVEAHCITQIPPSQIVEAFEALEAANDVH